jgi:hypothetical protein
VILECNRRKLIVEKDRVTCKNGDHSTLWLTDPSCLPRARY